MASEPADRARLSAFDLGCVAVGGIIGVGIYFTPGNVARACGDATQVVAAWCIGGAVALLGALVFAELAVRVPGHGGTFVYLKAAFGALPAFLYGWANWLVIQAGALGVIGLILVDNLGKLLAVDFSTHVQVALAALAILVFVAVNLCGLTLGKRVQNALTVTKTLAVFGIVALALFVRGRVATAQTAPAVAPVGWLAAMAGAILPVMFSSGGWQQASFVAGAARVPRRDVPLGLVGGVIVVVVAYVTVNLAFLDLLGFAGLRASTTVGVAATDVAFESLGIGTFAGRIVAAVIVISAAGIMNTICLAPPWVLHTMANEGLFPRSFARLDERRQVPARAIVVQGVWGVLLLFGAHVWVMGTGGTAKTIDVLDMLTNGVVFVDWIFFTLAGLALWKLRAESPSPGFALPLGSPIAALFTVAGLAITVGAIWRYPQPSLAGLLICALGLPFFLAMSKRARADG